MLKKSLSMLCRRVRQRSMWVAEDNQDGCPPEVLLVDSCQSDEQPLSLPSPVRRAAIPFPSSSRVSPPNATSSRLACSCHRHPNRSPLKAPSNRSSSRAPLRSTRQQPGHSQRLVLRWLPIVFGASRPLRPRPTNAWTPDP
jgi:hypothetical protein